MSEFPTDEEILASRKPAAVKKPAPQPAPKEEAKKAAAAPAKSSGLTKAPSGPDVQEEDLGVGLTKEEAIEKVESFYE